MSTIPKIYIPSDKRIESVEGIDHINVSLDANTEIGKMLSPAYYHPFYTHFGKMPSINTALNYLLIDDYPEEFLQAKSFTDEEKKFVEGKERKTIRNYYATVAYLITQRIICDPKLKEMIKNLDPDIVITSYYNTKQIDKEMKEMCYKPRYKMGNYLIILRNIIDDIQTNHFDYTSTMSYISQLIMNDKRELQDDSRSMMVYEDYKYSVNT